VKIVIVGGVAGGMSAATRARRLDEHADITVYEQGPYVSFANCGLPYFVGGVIPERDALLLQTPESLWSRFRIDVRVKSRVVAIDPRKKTVTVLNRVTEEATTESYDALILSPGASPKTPSIPGIERALQLRDVPDATAIKVAAQKLDAKTVVILGAGFIGIEIAENLHARGLEVTIVQSGQTVLPGFDPEMIEPFQATLESNGIRLELNATATAIGSDTVALSTGRELPADIVISSIGVQADNVLAVSAGLRLAESGAIWVDENQRTSDPQIFAVGDAAQKTNFLTGDGQPIWLANLANRHGRLVADVVAGDGASARPSIGTGIIGAFGMVAAFTGLTEKQAVKEGIPHSIAHLHPGSHAGYYPGSHRIDIKVLFEPVTGRLLGAQAIGRDGADKRIDVIATAIYAGLTVRDLMNLELAYAPQFGSAKDAVNQVGYVGDNMLAGNTDTVQWHELAHEMAGGAVLIDVRTERENEAGAIPGSVCIPVDNLRDHLAEHAADFDGKRVIVHCQVGQRGHTATQIFRAHGINVANLDGGWLTWSAGQRALGNDDITREKERENVPKSHVR
jgi:NADPH-dependent 2,4-dienoyl-CoA reductase/sulfur reductase-like enzyme/rhodanese-related sulfurtransferase